ncbi:MAG TPA: DNA mismatch repair protein MutS, partial [Myxococcales bacterium]|nr:DNA mismatch repair protein MutS [Myxococcales bacterium]
MAESVQPPALTPMMRQYHEAKSQARDALLLFRMGDFYELFHDDARLAAQILGITLTARSKGPDAVPMAGVPHHAAKAYIARLIAAGYKVAVCDQMELPGPGKQIVRREIVRLITPGTLLDEESLEAREPLWLAALMIADDAAALALLDASTGELRALPAGSIDAALDELVRVRPREVLLPEGSSLFEDVRKISGALRVEPRLFRDKDSAEQLLKRHLGVATLDGFGLTASLSIQAAAEALGYLQETQRSLAQHVVSIAVERPSRWMWIDPGAAQNLELFRGPDGRRNGSLLSVVDRTLTAAGGRLLARWLSAPLLQLEEISQRQAAVEELSQAAVVREELGERLRPVLDLERLLGRLAMGQGLPRDLAGLRASLQQMPALGALLLRRASSLLQSLAPPLSALGELTALLDRALVDEVPAGREPGFVRPGYRPDLDELSDLAQGGRAAIAAMEAAEKARTGIHSLKVRYNKIFGFYIEITKANLHLVPRDYQRKSSTVGAERFVTPALSEHEAKVLSAEDRRNGVEREVFDELRAAVLACSPALRACAGAAAQADALLSLGRVAAEAGWVRPVVDEGGGVEIIQGRHPVVERALAGSS